MKHLQSTLTKILPASLILFSLSTAQAEPVFGVSARLQYFNYEEFEPSGISLDSEKGFIPGIGFSLGDQQQTVKLDIYDGKVDYDGQLQSGTPFKTDTDQTIYKLAYRYHIPFANSSDQDQYYLGVSYQFWERDINGRGAVNGLFETYSWWAAEAGVQSTVFRHHSGRLQLELGFMKIYYADITVDLQDFGYGEPVLNLGNEPGIQAALVYRDTFGDGYNINMGIEYTHSEFGRSDSATISNGFNTITITEPDSTSNHISLYVELVQTF